MAESDKIHVERLSCVCVNKLPQLQKQCHSWPVTIGGEFSSWKNGNKLPENQLSLVCLENVGRHPLPESELY